MKKFLFMSIALLLAGMSVPAEGKVVKDSIDSKILNATVEFNVYLPDGFDKSDRMYPSVYLLHGLYGTFQDWENNARMSGIANELITSGEACEMVIFMPNAGGSNVHEVQNGYFNVKDWRYEDFFFQEFIPTVEKKYRCIGDKGHRAIMGLSMGGGGSTAYCEKHPDMFSSCYAMSAWLDTDVDPSMPENDKFTYTVKGVRENSTLDFVDNADDATIEALRTVKWFFDCGDDDGLLYLSVDLHKKLKMKRVSTELRVHNGAHNWEYWHNALRDALPFATRNFSNNEYPAFVKKTAVGTHIGNSR